MKKYAFLLSLLFPVFLHAQANDELLIRRILSDQVTAWNNGNLDDFMKGYWNSDSLMFIGKSGITYGYQNTLNNYKRSYGDTARMGKLSFDIIKVQRLSPEYYFVVGKWHLARSVGDIGGHYNLLIRKIGGQWKIVADHSS